jgi:hypothetical protein
MDEKPILPLKKGVHRMKWCYPLKIVVFMCYPVSVSSLLHWGDKERFLEFSSLIRTGAPLLEKAPFIISGKQTGTNPTSYLNIMIFMVRMRTPYLANLLNS